MKNPLFKGCATALVTPFHMDGSLDEKALIRLIGMQRAAGVQAIVLLGTTGEPSTLTMEERERVLALGKEAAGNTLVIVGTGSNDTRQAAEYARQAQAHGAAGQLCVTPYYNKSTQEGLIRHFSLIADSCDLPMLLYNVPSRTGMSIAPETVKALSKHPGIAGIKEASGDLSLSARMLEATDGDFPLYAGNDDLILPMMAQGALGVISVASNILPAQVCALADACKAGRFNSAQSIQMALLPLIRQLFSQVNPIPVKAALAAMGLIEESLRLPLTPLEHPYRAQLMDTLKAMKLIEES